MHIKRKSLKLMQEINFYRIKFKYKTRLFHPKLQKESTLRGRNSVQYFFRTKFTSIHNGDISRHSRKWKRKSGKFSLPDRISRPAGTHR